MDAEEIQIWTDVDGIMTTDPRIAPEAAKVKVISFAEASELAYFGARFAPEHAAARDGQRFRARVCSWRPEAAGTAIVRNAPPSRAVVKAIAFKRGITVINVTSTAC